MHVSHLGKAYICSAKFSPEILNFPVRAHSNTFENKKLSLHHLCTHRHVSRKDGHFDTVRNCFLSKSISVCKMLYNNLDEKKKREGRNKFASVICERILAQLELLQSHIKVWHTI